MSLTPTEAMRQAGDTAHDFTSRAIRSVREILNFGERRIDTEAILERYPVIVAAIVQASALDYSAWVLHHSAERLAQAIEQAGNHDKPS